MKKIIAVLLLVIAISTFLSGCRLISDFENALFWYDYAMESSRSLRESIEDGR